MSEITVSVVGSSSINPTVGNGDTVNVTIAPTGERGPTGAQGPAGPANVLSVGTVTSSGTASATLTGTSPSQVLNLVLPKGDAGTPATNIELQASATHLQWRYVGDTSWTNLVALSAITGPQGSTGAAGTPVELQTTSTHIQWRYVGGSTWTNVIALSSLVGATGATGATGPQGPAGSVNLGDETPQPLGTASAGTALNAARADHVHAVPSIAYSSLTGVPATFAPAAHTQAISTVTGLQDALDGKQAAGSYATLVGGTVPSSQLPSYVDDVIEYSALSAFPSTNDGGKIFVARDTGKIYRWSGSAYVEISPSPGSTDSVTEGSTNLYHTNARAAAAAPVQSVAGRTGTVTISASDVSGLAAVATSGSASDLSAGTVPSARLPIATDTSAGAIKIGSGLTITDGVVSASGGSGGGSYTLPTATSSVLGGIKVGSGLSITDGVLAATGGGGSGEDSLLRSLFVPPAPTGVSAVAGNAQAVVSWTAPTGVIAQAPVTDYVVQFKQGNGSWETFSDGTSTATSATVTSLANGQAYTFRVAAVNAVGQGPWSAASIAVTPTAGDPYWANVQLLLPGDTSVNDVSSYSRSVSASGGAAVSTAQKRWGAGSIYFDGSGDWVATDTTSALTFGTADFTIEFWARPTGSQPSNPRIMGNLSANAFTTGDWALTQNLGCSLYAFNYSSSTPIVSLGSSLTDDTWTHIAIVRSGNNWTMYKDGTAVSTNTWSGSLDSGTRRLVVGSSGSTVEAWNGYIDDLRVTVGSDRSYAGATIPVPTAAFPDA